MNEVYLRGETNEASKDSRNSDGLVDENALGRTRKLQPVPTEEIPAGKGGDDLHAMSAARQGLRQADEPFDLSAQ